MTELITYKPIGIIRTEHTDLAATPIQPLFASDCRGRVEVLEEYAEGLRDIEGFSHIYLLYHLDRARETRLIVRPYLDDTERGVFATRAPKRPNPIGLSIVRLLSRYGRVLQVEGADMLDGSPLLDIKPYVRRFDPPAETRDGWLAGVTEATAEQRGRRKR